MACYDPYYKRKNFLKFALGYIILMVIPLYIPSVYASYSTNLNKAHNRNIQWLILHSDIADDCISQSEDDPQGTTQQLQLSPLPADTLPAPLVQEDVIFISTGQTLTWDSSFFMNAHTVIIDSNATLIIHDTVYVKPQSKIIVERGGRLEIDGGAIIGHCLW